MPRRLEPGARLVIATHNPGKLAEIADLLRPHGIAAVSAGDLGLPEPLEDAPDFHGNARIKALAAAASSGLPALADDSGFCVAALRGAPGVLSARWAGPNKDFAAAMARVRDAMGAAGDRDAPAATAAHDTTAATAAHDAMAAVRDRRAWFVSALCLGWPDGHADTFIGRVDGVAVWPPRGAHGFGYDPMFAPGMEAAAETYGEMAPARKHATSHRARAMAQLLAGCVS